MQLYIVRLYVVGAVLNQRLITVLADSEEGAKAAAERLIAASPSLCGYAVESATLDD